MKILVAGSRHWVDKAKIRAVLEKAIAGVEPGSVKVIHGGNGYYRIIDRVRTAVRGADALAGEIALSLGCEVAAHPADWTRFGLAAGPKRNAQMVLLHHLFDDPIQSAFLFHENIAESKGTRDMLDRIKRASIPHWIITPDTDVASIQLE